MSRFSRDISIIDRHLRKHRREYMGPLGLKGIHARLFMMICRCPGLSQDQLARRMWFDKSTIARQLELLENKGFVERRSSESDKRVLCVYPTQAMLDFHPGLRAATESWENELLQDLTPEEKEQFDYLLAKIRSRVGRED